MRVLWFRNKMNNTVQITLTRKCLIGKKHYSLSTQLGCIHTQQALSDNSCDRELHTERKIFLKFVVGLILYLSVKRSEMSEKSILHNRKYACIPEINQVSVLTEAADPFVPQKLNSWKSMCLLLQSIDDRLIGIFFFQMPAFRVEVTHTVQLVQVYCCSCRLHYFFRA